MNSHQRQIMLALAALLLVAIIGAQCRLRSHTKLDNLVRMRRSHGLDHKNMFHSHLSRKVFDRACSASKDTIDEIIACVTGSDVMSKTMKDDTAKNCYKEAFGANFDANDVTKHKELICNNRDKFEGMTACVYKKTGEQMNPKEMEKFTESLVDVGICIINALDG